MTKIGKLHIINDIVNDRKYPVKFCTFNNFVEDTVDVIFSNIQDSGIMDHVENGEAGLIKVQTSSHMLDHFNDVLLKEHGEESFISYDLSKFYDCYGSHMVLVNLKYSREYIKLLIDNNIKYTIF